MLGQSASEGCAANPRSRFGLVGRLLLRRLRFAGQFRLLAGRRRLRQSLFQLLHLLFVQDALERLHEIVVHLLHGFSGFLALLFDDLLHFGFLRVGEVKVSRRVGSPGQDRPSQNRSRRRRRRDDGRTHSPAGRRRSRRYEVRTHRRQHRRRQDGRDDAQGRPLQGRLHQDRARTRAACTRAASSTAAFFRAPCSRTRRDGADSFHRQSPDGRDPSRRQSPDGADSSHHEIPDGPHDRENLRSLHDLRGP